MGKPQGWRWKGTSKGVTCTRASQKRESHTPTCPVLLPTRRCASRVTEQGLVCGGQYTARSTAQGWLFQKSFLMCWGWSVHSILCACACVCVCDTFAVNGPTGSPYSRASPKSASLSSPRALYSRFDSFRSLPQPPSQMVERHYLSHTHTRASIVALIGVNHSQAPQP